MKAQSRTSVVAAAACLIVATAAPFAAAAAIDLPDAKAAIGAWDMSLDDTNRKCRMMLREEPGDAGQAIAMPAGCRRAMPILMDVGGWTSAARGELGMLDRAGKPVLAFTASSERDALVATGPEGETYQLTPAVRPVRVAQATGSTGVPGFQTIQPPPAGAPRPARPAPAAAQSAQASPAATPGPAAAGPPARAGEVAGRYAVLRDGKDTHCMVTLDDKARGLKGSKAQLAPACRDQGVVIFDPAGWSLERGRLVLTARKGHQAHFDRDAAGVWQKDPKEGKNLGLRRL